MTCARYRALISRYLDDELTPRQRAELLDHIEHCPACSAALARYRRDDLLLRKLPAEDKPTPAVKGKVLEEIRRGNSSPRRRLTRLLALRRRVSPRLAAPALLLLPALAVAAGLFVLNAERQDMARQLGFSPPATATVPSLDVPASFTPPLNGAAPPRLLTTVPFDGAASVDPNAGLLLSFDQPMDRRSVEHALRFSPPVPGDFTWDADNQVRFNPATGLLRGVSYTVALTDGARSRVGVPLPPTTIWGFSTLPAPALAAAYPAPDAVGVPAAPTLVLTFTRPMEPASVPPLHLSADGRQLGGTALWSPDGRVMRFTPAAPLPPGEVHAYLAGGKDRASGSVAPTAWSFNVAAPANQFNFTGQRLLALSLGGEPSVGYTAGSDPSDLNARNLRFALYPIDQPALEAEMAWLASPDAADPAAPWPRPSAAGRAPARTWSVPIRGDKMELHGRQGLSHTAGPLSTGISVHEPGIYLLTGELSGSRGDARLVVLGDESIVLLTGGGQLRAWVSKLGTGRSVAGAMVWVYDDAGASLASGVTDAHGIFTAPLPPGKMPSLVLSEKDGEFAAAYADDAARQPLAASADNLDATVLLDRSRYRPGDLVQFMAVVRPPPPGAAGAPASVSLSDPIGREIGALTLQPDAHGAVHGSFLLPEGAALGTYSLLFGLNARAMHTGLLVIAREDAPGDAALQLGIGSAAGPLYAATDVTATIRADYGPSAVAPSLPLTLSLTEDAAPGVPAVVVTGTTGEDGIARIPLHLPMPQYMSPRGATYTLLVSGEDGDGRTATAAAVWTVRAGHELLEQSLPAHAFAPGTKALVTIRARDQDGHPLSGQPVNTGLAAPVLPADGSPESASLLSQVGSVTNAEGVATATLSLPLQGAFRVLSVITDSAGSRLEVETRIFVYRADSGAPWAVYPSPQAGLTITPDAASYRPGETAHLLIQAGDSGGGLVISRLGGRVVGVRDADFAAGGGLADVPIPSVIGVETHLDVQFLRFVAGADGPQPVSADISLPLLPAAGARIDTSLPDPSLPSGYDPGTALPLRLSVHNDAGQPVSGEVLLRLAGVGPDAPTAYWNSAALDAAGQLSATLGLPADAGDWNLDIWAFTPGGLSHTSRRLHTEPPLAVDWAAPASLVSGDTSTVAALVTNNEPAAANVSIRLGTAGEHPPDVTGPSEQTFRLAPGETHRVSWSLRAAAPGSGRFVLDLTWDTSGDRSDSVHRAQSVTTAPYGISDEQTRAGTVGTGETINMTLPADVDPATAGLEIRCAPTLGSVLADAALALTPVADSRPGPVADVAARLGAESVAGVAMRRLGLAGDLPSDTPDIGDLDYLYSSQATDGGWGAWPGSASDLDTTTAVLSALRQLSQTGDTHVDAGTVSRGLAWLRQAAETPRAPGGTGTMPGVVETEQTAAALYTLSLYGAGDPGAVDRLLAAEARLTSRARALLALTLAASGRAAEARLVVERLADGAGESADPVVLDALLGADSSAHGPVVAVFDRLLVARKGATWGNPPATDAAIRALSRYMSAVPESPPTGSYRVLVNGTLVREVVAVPGASGSGGTVLTLPGSSLHTGDNSVRLETGGGHLYYSLRVHAVLAADEHPIASRRSSASELGLLRVYQPGPRTGTTIVLTLTVVSAVGNLRLDDPLPAGLARLPALTFARLDGPPDAPTLQDMTAALHLLSDRPDQPGLHAMLTSLAPGTYMLTYGAAHVAPGNYTALPALVQSTDDPSIWVRSGGDSLSVAP
ncbi:MAG: Ig-like domain-containing protein [Chloroflexia bacterium]